MRRRRKHNFLLPALFIALLGFTTAYIYRVEMAPKKIVLTYRLDTPLEYAKGMQHLERDTAITHVEITNGVDTLYPTTYYLVIHY